MSRKKNVYKRDISPDPIYNSKLVTKIINTIMEDGKKRVAQNILYKSFDMIKEVTKKEPIDVFNQALNNVMPILEVRTRTIGSQNYQVPSEVHPERRQSLGLKWLIQYAKKRNGKSMIEKLSKEIIDASNGIGLTVKKKEDTYKMAEANKAFAHHRW
ncbi:30S ribosomal protein S7 [Candidatus Phytoplasma sacchari]|uniref:Small ribosomal subunit protein uS7 n=1 Tax=Candidatus Phytoplasma sacchari TaxID=2609813 RepID=A0ABY7M0L9_9MOLU|nr:30S ribosomal protein S7 [Candidatus Phytoplasma sacchari]KAB8122805.1 30S ribosomal protein S7 [Candidatus Phytoplasma sacchari]WBL31275.1 30S ribosomal protein S7 [Candidatus Phytoplasma sacchari]